MAYTKKQIKEAIDTIEGTRVGLFVYASETKSGYHIYSIGQNEVQFATQKEAQDVLMTLAGKSSTPTGKRSYTPRTEAGIRRHLQAEEKRITKTYKNPVEPETHKVSIKRISKNGKIYYVTKEVQNVSLESEFRRTQRAWTKAAKEYQNLAYEEQKHSPKISGHIKKSTFKNILETRGEEGARRYLESMYAKAKGYSVYGENQDLRDTAETIRRLVDRMTSHGYIKDRKLWDQAYFKIFNTGTMKYDSKEKLITEMYNQFYKKYKDYAMPGAYTAMNPEQWQEKDRIEAERRLNMISQDALAVLAEAEA